MIVPHLPAAGFLYAPLRLCAPRRSAAIAGDLMRVEALIRWHRRELTDLAFTPRTGAHAARDAALGQWHTERLRQLERRAWALLREARERRG